MTKDPMPPAKQREKLTEFSDALNSRLNAIRKDDCGDLRIVGKNGWISAVPEGFQIYFDGSPLAWSWCKKAFKGFAKLTMDCDEDGIHLMERLPTPAEAETIRDKLGVYKRLELTEENQAKRRAWAEEINRKRKSDG